MLWFDGAVKRDPAIDAWLNEQAPELLKAIATRWFFQMRDTPFGYVNVFKTHVNVGFFIGAELDDPVGLLEGSGRRMRYVTLKPDIAIDDAALRALIHAAYADIKSRLIAN